MYAVIRSGGKQYRVAPGQVVKLETLALEAGADVNFDEILMVADGDKISIGQPNLDKAKVVGKVVEHARGDKVTIIKFKRRKQYMKKMGHRQNYTAVEITEIKA